MGWWWWWWWGDAVVVVELREVLVGDPWLMDMLKGEGR